MAALVAASWLLIYTGLPNRAEFTGNSVLDGRRIAPEINALAPPFTQPTLNGDTLVLDDLRGESVVINFWATWCVPCRTEMPELQALHADTGVRVLAVNLAENPQAVREWVTELGLTFTIVLDAQGQIAEAYRLRGQPSTYVVAPDGIITHIFYGATTADALRDALRTHRTHDED